MGIGTSLGTYHDDEMAYQSNQFFSPDPDQPGVLKPSWQTDKKGEQDAQEFQDMKTDLPTKAIPISDSGGPSLLQSFGTMLSRTVNDPDIQSAGDFGPVPFRNANDSSQRTANQAAEAVRAQTSNIGPDTGTRLNPTDRTLEVIDRALNEGGLAAQSRAGRTPARIGVEPVDTPEQTSAPPRGWINTELSGAVSRNLVDARTDKAKLLDELPAIAQKGSIQLKDMKPPEDTTSGHKFGFMNDKGLKGEMTLYEREDGKRLQVGWIGGLQGKQAEESINEFGKSDMRALLSLIKDHFPKAEVISGWRVSGARAGDARAKDDVQSGRAEVRLRRSKSGPARKDIDQLIDEWNAGPDSSP